MELDYLETLMHDIVEDCAVTEANEDDRIRYAACRAALALEIIDRMRKGEAAD